MGRGQCPQLDTMAEVQYRSGGQWRPWAVSSAHSGWRQDPQTSCGQASSEEQLGPGGLSLSCQKLLSLQTPGWGWVSRSPQPPPGTAWVPWWLHSAGSLQGLCLPLARQDIRRSYIRGLSDAHAHPSGRRHCLNSASSCWPGTNSPLSTSLPQPPSALLAGVSEAKSGEGEN